MFRSLTEMLNTKHDKLVMDNENQKSLLEEARNYKLKPFFNNTHDKILLEYKHPEIKKRAQTIGLAFNIAAKSLVCMLAPIRDNVKNNYFEKNLFSLENELWKPVYDELLSMGEPYAEVFNSALKWFLVRRYEFDSKNMAYTINDYVMSVLVSHSVTVAWLMAKYKSGFFPADTSVMLRDNAERSMMEKEVIELLREFYNQVVHHLVVAKASSFNDYVGPTSDIYVEPTIEDNAMVECSIDFIFLGTALEITSASSIPSSINKVNLEAFDFLNSKHNKYAYSSKAIRFIRYDAVFYFKKDDLID